MSTDFCRRTGISTVLLLALACQDVANPDPLTAPLAARANNYSAWSTPVNLGPLVNSPFPEQQMTLSRDGLTLYFASFRPTDPADVVTDQNIWVAQRACDDAADAACAWTAPVLLGPAINGAFADGSPTLSRDEHYLYFHSQRARDDCPVAPCDRDVWVSYRDDVHDDFAWQEPLNAGPGVNGPGEDLAPSFFENDDGAAPELFFTRGLLADADLYVSHQLADGSWGPSAPVTELNTPGIPDARPAVAHHGLEIYFWSSRSGSSRIYSATRESTSDGWAVPVMVPSPIADAPSLVPAIHSRGNTEALYFTRAVPGAGQDIFMSHRTRGGAGSP